MAEYQEMLRRVLRKEVWRAASFGEAVRLLADGWARYPDNPVLTPAAGEASAYHPRVIIHPETGKYWMYYADHAIVNGVDKGAGILLAESDDGFTWTKLQPVIWWEFDWEKPMIHHCYVIYDYEEELFKMWYRGGAAPKYKFGYAYSPDGLTWTKRPEPVFEIDPKIPWEARTPWGVENPIVWKDRLAGIYYLWYMVSGKATPTGFGTEIMIGVATSKDGVEWKRYQKNPVIRDGGHGDVKFIPNLGFIFITVTAYSAEHAAHRFGRGARAWYSPDGFRFMSFPKPILADPRIIPWEREGIVSSHLIFNKAHDMLLLYYGGYNGTLRQTGVACRGLLNPWELRLWRDQSITTAGLTSRYILCAGYKRKTFSLISDQPGTMRVEVDYLGDGTWETLEEIPTETVTQPDETTKERVRVMSEYNFMWARIRFVPTATATVQAKCVLSR